MYLVRYGANGPKDHDELFTNNAFRQHLFGSQGLSTWRVIRKPLNSRLLLISLIYCICNMYIFRSNTIDY